MRVVVVAGPGARPDVDAVRRFAARTNLGVVNTWGLKGLFPWDSPFHLGTAGLQARDFELAGVQDAERVVGVGLDEDESPRAQLGALTEVSAADLDALAAELGRNDEPPTRPPLYTALAAAVGPLYAADDTPMNPARAARDLASVDAFVAADPGPAGLWVARTYPTTKLGSVFVPARRDGSALEAALAHGGPAVVVTTAPLRFTPRGDVVVEVWGDDRAAMTPDERLARLQHALSRPGPHVLPVPVDFSWTRVLVDVAGPVRAWTE